MYLSFDIDGSPTEIEVNYSATLQQVLQTRYPSEQKKGHSCATGSCGACTILLNGIPVLACLTLAGMCRGQHIVTANGLKGAKYNPIRRLFARSDISPCGACISGILISASSLLAANPRPTRNDVRHALAGHACRCVSYSSIVNSVIAASEQPEQLFVPHEILPSQDQIIAALAHQQEL